MKMLFKLVPSHEESSGLSPDEKTRLLISMLGIHSTSIEEKNQYPEHPEINNVLGG